MRMFKSLLSLSLPLATTGCISGAIPAPVGSELRVPGSVSISISPNVSGDGFGAVIPLDVHVSKDGEPLERIEVELKSGYPTGIYLLPAEAVKVVDYPNTPSDVESQQDVYDMCVDENGNFSNEDEWCAWYWDTETAQYYQFGYDYAGGDEEFAPTYMIGQTDGHGNLRFFLYVDSLPIDESGAQVGTTIDATIATGTESFAVGPNGDG
jgi:hypothetical protein